MTEERLKVYESHFHYALYFGKILKNCQNV